MSTMGIRLGVDWSQVKTAKSHVDDLNKSLLGTGKRDINLLPDMEASNEILKEVAKEITKIRSIASKGEKSGGILSKRDLKEAEKLAKDIGKDFKSYEKSLDSVADKLDGLISKRRQLQNMRDKSWRKSEQKELDGQISEINRKIATASKFFDKHGVKSGALQRQFDDAYGSIGGMRAPIPGQGLGKKAMKYGLALAGGASVYAMATDAMGRAVGYNSGMSKLEMQHNAAMVRALNNGRATMGYGAMEHLEIAGRVSGGTGFTNYGLVSAIEDIKRFSRGAGVDADITSGHAAATYQATGLRSAEYTHLLKEIKGALKEGDIRGRSETFMSNNQSMIQQISAGRGGAAMSSGDMTRLTDMQLMFWTRAGVMGQGQSGLNLMSKLDSGIRSGGGGDPNKEMFMMNALAGGNIRGIDDYVKYLKVKDKGLLGSDTSDSNLNKVMDYTAKRFGKNKDGGLSSYGLINLMESFGLTIDQAQMMSDLYGRGELTSKNLKKRGAELIDGSDYEEDQNRYLSTKGGQHSQLLAEIEDLKIALGEPLVDAIDGFKEVMVDAAKVIAHSFGINQPAPKLQDDAFMSWGVPSWSSTPDRR